ncbi:putative F-box protein At3g10430 [Triticum aestivum]|uniref:putative F-box protein At3g10430 n=1 Tax=Triticum aestivum TaxID=4565 RepID=UPI000842368A|nr:putative F-box protein At3g10430 [Triticum aestivum]
MFYLNCREQFVVTTMDANPPKKKRKICTDETAAALSLPDAVVLDILERLPTDDVLRFRHVCRAWRATVGRDPAFARAHLQRWRAEMPVVSPCSPGSGPFLKIYRYRESGECGGPVSRVQLRSPRSFDRSIVHCDGVLLVCSAAELLAWNPATGESARLPRGAPSCSGAGIDRLGFCYDAAARALKAVRYYYRVHDVQAGAYSIGVEVLALGQGQGPPSWRPAARDPPCPIYGTPPASVGSTVYWVIDDRFLDGAGAGPKSQAQPGASTLLSFDVTSGEYSVVDGPPCRWRCQDVALGNVGGALCVVATWKSLLGTVWLRTAAGTWTQVLGLDTEYILARVVPVGMCASTGEMLLLAGRSMHHCCIAGTGKARVVVDVRGQLKNCGRNSARSGVIAKTLVFMYTPSLIKIAG